MNTLKGRDILKAEQFTREDIDLICTIARDSELALAKQKQLELLRGFILATLFFEPSTRTRLSFETAMLRLGGEVITVAEPMSSSVAKGESLYDTIKTVENYADIIVLRHPKVGAAEEAAAAAEKPVINAGDGAGEHPTQALLDIYTILKEKRKIDGLTISLVGDLKNARTAHSLAKVLSLYKVRLILVSPEVLQLPDDVKNWLKRKNIEYVEVTELSKALPESDILYITRIQKERFEDQDLYEKYKNIYLLTADMITLFKRKVTIMHPLPRVTEISKDLDCYEGAAYFRQVANGVPVRMALLALVAGVV